MKDNSITNDELTISEVIEMAWCDKTSFEAIYNVTGLTQADVIKIMRNNLKPSSFRLWRKRVSGRQSKHQVKLRMRDR